MNDAGLSALRKNGLLLSAVGIVVIRLGAALFTAHLALSFAKKGPWFRAHHTSLGDLFDRWDARRYIQIAHFGYSSIDSHAFFPAYPLLIRLISPVFGYP